MQVPSGTARRLSLALAALVSLFVVSSVLVLVHMREIHSRLVEMQARQHAVRSALEVASAIRDTYAHQAHTLILGNDSHLHFYETAAARVTRLTQEMKVQALGPEERAWVADIERAQGALDMLFREALLPAVPERAARASVAFMELGALVCTARVPRCAACPLVAGCAWRLSGSPPADGPAPQRRTQRYAGTDRQVRGLLLAVLRDAPGPVPGTRLDSVWPDADQRTRALAGLLADRLVCQPVPQMYALPGGPAERMQPM